jgi:anti-anti-sigma regulatory factor
LAGKAHLLELRGRLGLREAAELAAELGTALEAHPAVTIATGELTEIDVSILQILVSAHKSAARAGKTLTIGTPADGVLHRTLVRAGFAGPDGAPRTPEGQFWTVTNGRTKGKPA